MTAMNTVWIILGAVCFIGGQVLLLYCLRVLDSRLNRQAEKKLNAVLKENNRNSDEDMLE